MKAKILFGLSLICSIGIYLLPHSILYNKVEYQIIYLIIPSIMSNIIFSYFIFYKKEKKIEGSIIKLTPHSSEELKCKFISTGIISIGNIKLKDPLIYFAPYHEFDKGFDVNFVIFDEVLLSKKGNLSKKLSKAYSGLSQYERRSYLDWVSDVEASPSRPEFFDIYAEGLIYRSIFEKKNILPIIHRLELIESCKWASSKTIINIIREILMFNTDNIELAELMIKYNIQNIRTSSFIDKIGMIFELPKYQKEILSHIIKEFNIPIVTKEYTYNNFKASRLILNIEKVDSLSIKSDLSQLRIFFLKLKQKPFDEVYHLLPKKYKKMIKHPKYELIQDLNFDEICDFQEIKQKMNMDTKQCLDFFSDNFIATEPHIHFVNNIRKIILINKDLKISNEDYKKILYISAELEPKYSTKELQDLLGSLGLKKIMSKRIKYLWMLGFNRKDIHTLSSSDLEVLNEWLSKRL